LPYPLFIQKLRKLLASETSPHDLPPPDQ